MSSSTCETVWAGMSTPDKAGVPLPRDVLISCNRVTWLSAALTSASQHMRAYMHVRFEVLTHYCFLSLTFQPPPSPPQII